jgi:hypothetical protein
VNKSRALVTATCGVIIIAASLLPLVGRAASKQKPRANSFTTIGKVLKFTNGDLMCYVEIYAHNNNYTIGADFAICNQTKFLNQQVQLTYKRSRVNDCQGNEPCGKTRLENLIVKMKLAPKQ